MSTIYFKRLHPDAILPNYQHEGDSGFDLHCVEDVCVWPHHTLVVKTGLAAEIPRGTEVQIRPRSGIALKTTLILPNSPGTIDNGYRGEWGVIVRNIGEKEVRFKKGDRIAQAVLVPVIRAAVVEVEELNETSRGDGAYGSTGIAA